MNVFERKTQLVVKKHDIQKPKFSAIDFHTHFGNLFGSMVHSKNYFDLYETKDVIELIRSHGIEKIVNLDGGMGDEFLRVQEKLKDAGDFIVHFGQMPVDDFEDPGFENWVYKTLKELHANGIRGMKFWKIIGLSIRDKFGKYLRPDDKRLQCIWQTAGELKMPILFHIADPMAFFAPVDEKNEFLEIFEEHPEWSFSGPEFYSYSELMEMQENLLAANPNTTFVIPHVGGSAENLGQLGKWLDRFPNMYVDIADRLNEVGRQPYTAKDFFETYADRILFGTDLLPNDIERYPIYFRFLETNDEYFNYRTDKGVFLGNWHIYGIKLSDETLRKIYRENAAKLLGIK